MSTKPRPKQASKKQTIQEFVAWWPTSKPVPYARNARKIPQSAIDKVAASIKEFGFRQPIVVDTDGVIVAGHCRLLAAQKLQLKQVPVHVAHELTAAQIKAYRLADNRAAEESDWDYQLIPIELEELQELGFDLTLTGFNPDELTTFLEGPAFGPGSAEEQSRLDQTKTQSVICPNCSHEFTHKP
jgi:hypothetical protein